MGIARVPSIGFCAVGSSGCVPRWVSRGYGEGASFGREVGYGVFLVVLVAECAGKSADDLVFTNAKGEHIREQAMDGNGWYTGALERSKVPRLAIHDLRHAAASIAISSGANVKAVQRMLGHKSAAMTLDIYGELFDTDLDSVAVNVNRKIAEELNDDNKVITKNVKQ